MTLPFTKRTTASVAVFACMFVAQTAQAFAIGASLGSINNLYYALLATYEQLITVPPFQVSTTGTVPPQTLDQTITQAQTQVGQLNTLIQAIPPGQVNPQYNYLQYGQNPNQVNPTKQVSLAHLQRVVANGLTQINLAAAAADDGE
jgi:hypothetical protein